MARLSMKQVTAYLMSKGVPKGTINDIRVAFTEDAVKSGKDIQADRIYTLIAIMLHDCYGMGRVRIVRGLQKFDELCGLAADEYPWEKLMEELHEKTGIVIHSGDDDRLIFEYKP